MKAIIFSIFLIIFLNCSATAFGQNINQKQNYCRLFSSLKKFENSAFQTKAYMTYSTVTRVDGGDSFFYFPECNNEDFFAVSNFSILNEQKKWIEFFQKLPEEKDFIFEVKFAGKLQTSVRPSFGHLGWSRAEIEVLRIDSIKNVSVSDKKRPNFDADSPLTAKGNELRLINNEIIFSLLGIGSSGAIVEKYFDKDFKVGFENTLIGDKNDYRIKLDQKFSDDFKNAKSFELRINSIKENENFYVINGDLKTNSDSKSEIINYENMFVFHNENWVLKETKFTKIKTND